MTVESRVFCFFHFDSVCLIRVIETVGVIFGIDNFKPAWIFAGHVKVLDVQFYRNIATQCVDYPNG
jgi:hypothetical protein